MPQTRPSPQPCPCGSGEAYDLCCGPLISGARIASTAESLMRSRYTAHATASLNPKAVDYILDTWAPEQRAALVRNDIAAWASGAQWLELQVISTALGQTGDNQGMVEFEARYRQQGRVHVHHERSLFCKRQGRWYFAGPLG